MDVGRPVKVNFSIDKGEEAYNFVEKIRSKFQRKRQVWPQLERMGTDVQNNPFASGTVKVTSEINIPRMLNNMTNTMILYENRFKGAH